MEDDDFFIDDDELNEEIPETKVDDVLYKFFESIEKKAQEAKGHIKHAEQGETVETFLTINRYVASIGDILQMLESQNSTDESTPKLSEDEIEEYLEQLELTARELSFKDIKQYKDKEKEVNIKDNPDFPSDQIDDLGF